ncbi:hypothetical protein LUZ60_001599 [Juncus effusus]|nr:hypothetical protein LUZ60_001599 [Juncus effusus]
MEATPVRNPAAAGEPKLFRLEPHLLLQLSSQIRKTLEATPYSPNQSSSLSIKSHLQSLLPSNSTSISNPNQIQNFFLLLSTIASAHNSKDSPILNWITEDLSSTAKLTLVRLREAGLYGSEEELIVDLVDIIIPDLKRVIKESCVDLEEEIVPKSAKSLVDYAIIASHQFRWIISQVGAPQLGKLSWLIIPCALTALDHWSPQVKEQALISFTHISNNVNKDEISRYEEAVLDAICRNIASVDEIWYQLVQISVLFLNLTQENNPRSPWLDRMMSEMLGHLERQPYNRERRIAWLSLIQPVFNLMGLFILAYFRRIFFLFFQWIHSDDDQTVLLVLERLHTIIKLTWIRKSPYTERLVDELVLLYKESATRKNREILRKNILQLLSLLQRCKGVQFETTWQKHTQDPDLVILISTFNQYQLEILGS